MVRFIYFCGILNMGARNRVFLHSGIKSSAVCSAKA